MLDTADVLLLGLYLVTVAGLSGYGLHRLLLVWLYHRHRRDAPVASAGAPPDAWPRVTVQLPIFNEPLVVVRLIDAVCGLDYPGDRLEIQVLDDSTDETCELARRAVERHRASGVCITRLHRTNRQGFKAGALQAGLHAARGEFVAIFDADFVPTPEFLRRTLSHFAEARVAMVQARWAHINRDFSRLTHAQSILLDGHFVIEHTARHRSGRFFNFNGTAGVWRREAIDDAGGWQHDTLTEDLDLSYRAQLRGWRFIFLTDLLAPAELPAEMNAFKAQQHRWAKGSVQVARKLLPRIFAAPLPLAVKAEAFVHLTSNVGYLLVLVLALLLPATLRIRAEHEWGHPLLLDVPFLLGSTLSIAGFYLLAAREGGQRTGTTLWHLPVVLSLGIGLALNNTKAALEAIIGHSSDFVRTPKLGIVGRGPVVADVRRRSELPALPSIPLLEVALGLYHVDAVVYAAQQGLYTAVPFLLLFLGGFLYAGLTSLAETVRAARSRAGLRTPQARKERGSSA